jgi:phosphatidylethanolamine/phosphatidyl-N-methylethanolamine N-methyltransferase
MHSEPRPRNAEEVVDSYYDQHYTKVHGSGQLLKAASVMHNHLERRRKHSFHGVTLELGAGSFQHYPYVLHARNKYIATDIRIPEQSPLLKELRSGTGPRDLEFRQMDATQLDLPTHSVDRVVASCLIMHLPDPLGAVMEWQRVCRPDGVIDFLVPCDPGYALRMFRRLVSESTAKRLGVTADEYRLVNAIEHISAFPRVLTLARAALEPNRLMHVEYFPLRFLRSWNLNAFAIVSIEPGSTR